MAEWVWPLPVHRGWRGAQAVVDQPHMALVQLQCQGIIVSLVKKDAIVLVSGHLGRVARACGLQLSPSGPTSQHLLKEAASVPSPDLNSSPSFLLRL